MTHEKRANRILVVDDDPKILAIIVQQLEKEGYVTRTAANGFDVGWTTQEFKPDLIILDIMLPGMNGIEVCRQLKSAEGTREIRIIGISATSDQGMIDRMRQAGVDEFMAKPFQLHKLKERIVHFIGEPRLDPSLLENNRVFLFSRDGAWAKSLAAALGHAGYETALAATPEEAGFRILKFLPDALIIGIDGPEPWIETMIARLRANPATARTAVLGAGDRVKPPGVAQLLASTAPPEQWVAAIRNEIGPQRKRRPKATARRLSAWTRVAVVTALVAVVAASVAVAVILSHPPSPLSHPPSPPSHPPSPFAVPSQPTLEDDIAVWRGQERIAELNNLVYYNGGWHRRDLMGTGVEVTLKDGTTREGHLAKSGMEYHLRTVSGIVRLTADEIVKQEPKRVIYEEYWDRAAKVPAGDTAGHYRLALWCRENGLKEPAVIEFRRALLADRNHADALKALGYRLKEGRWTQAR